MARKKIREDDLPTLMHILDEGRSEEQCDVLRLLCPCRNRVPYATSPINTRIASSTVVVLYGCTGYLNTSPPSKLP